MLKFSCSCLGNHGRVGNQLFQIHSTLGLAEKFGGEVVFPTWKYEEYFEPSLPHGDMQKETIREQYFHHYDWNLYQDCDLYGYFQSEKYFGSQGLKLNPHFLENCRNKYPQIWEKQVILIQIRRGDYVGNPNYYQVPITFYLDALFTHFPDWRDYNILITSDDIEYAKVHFECFPNVTFSEGNTDIEDLALGTLCDHFIISNSTFGWWQAYWGEKPGSKVIHSGHLFAGNLSKQNDYDYRPARWIEHKKDDYRLDLQDVTFNIPVYYDHIERRDNLDLSLCLLQKDFKSNFIVCEQGGNKFEYIREFAQYSKMTLPNFHRTRMLNWMAEVSKTPYIVNWDCDIILPPAQIYLAVETLKNGADMVYPYGGPFARMPREPWFKRLQKLLDIGNVGATKFRNREKDHFSVGGAVLWNREAFFEFGMENENMVSFGPEDVERFERAKRLGLDMQRIPGALFHLNHYVGPNSSPRNPLFRSNHAELDKIRKMSDPELRQYVDTWKWRHPYTPRYFHSIQEGAIKSAKLVMEALNFEPKTVIDLGCGLGEWHNNNPGYIGVDYRVKREQLLIPPERYIEHDLSKTPFKVDMKFGLAICLEVAEHLPESAADMLVQSLCALSDKVLFSAAIPYQGGTGHINEQWQSWWAELFKKYDFGTSMQQPFIFQNQEIEPWYRQNIVLYERGSQGKVGDFVLPDYYLQIVQNLHNRLHDLGK